MWPRHTLDRFGRLSPVRFAQTESHRDRRASRGRGRWVWGLCICLVGTSLPALASSERARSAQMRSFYNRWRGTPYRWGGTTRSGVDCSAYLRQMYRDLFRVELPRTTKQQIRVGVPLTLNPRRLEDGLHPGDAIFYVNRAGIPNHVVTYVGRGMITHSVSGRGVVMEKISKIYGRRVAARRYLTPPSGGPAQSLGDWSAEASSPSFEGAIEPLSAAEIQDIPCPDRYRADPSQVALYAREDVKLDLGRWADRELCEIRALAEALLKDAEPGTMAARNGAALQELARWVEDIETLAQDL